MEWSNWVGELALGVVLSLLALAFRNWATLLRESREDLATASAEIMERLDSLGKEVAEHRLKNESRMTRVEVELTAIHKRLDDCKISRRNSDA